MSPLTLSQQQAADAFRMSIRTFLRKRTALIRHGLKLWFNGNRVQVHGPSVEACAKKLADEGVRI